MTGPRADVYLDGELMASTAAEFYGHEITVLSGLKVDWGRSTAVDQPEPSSLGLSFVQHAGTSEFLRSLAVGRTLDVTATGRIDTGDVANVMSQGDFEGLAAGSSVSSKHSNAAVTVATEQQHSGAQSARARATTATAPSWVVFPPAPFSADLSAWDAIPRVSKGETWAGSAWVLARSGSTATLQAVAFTDPTGNSGTYVPIGPVIDAPGIGAWVQLTLPPLVIGQTGRWVGLRVSFDRLGPAWVDVPGAWTAQGTTAWLDMASGYVDDLVLNAPPGGTDRTVLVFQGRITDMEAKYLADLVGGSTQVDITAKDFTADLANNRIGDVPWLVEALETRVDRILVLAGTGVTAQVDGSIAATQVTWRDVDSQPAAELVTELAQSVAGVAWSAVHDPGGQYYWIEDPRNRTALYLLSMGGTGQAEIIPNPSAPDAIQLTASNVLEEPIRWTQDVGDVATRVDVTWLTQGVDDKGQPTTTETHALVVNATLEESLGQRGFSVSTQLISAADAQRVATTLLAAQHSAEWRLSGITWSIRYEAEMSRDEMVAALDLLDGTVRIGHSLGISALPPWVPLAGSVVVYLEGGSYTFEDGEWVLEMVGSSSGQGQSVTWATVDPTWPWSAFQHLAWVDLIGVAPAPPATEKLGV